MGGTVYAIAGGKGGVGKTTTAVNLGVVLGQAGQEVVVVDADLAMTDLGQHVGIDHEPGIHQVLAGAAPVRDAVVKGPGGLALVAGDPRLEAFAAANPAELRQVLDLLRIAYDVVLVDTGPGIQRETVITYRESDGVVLVTTDQPVAIEDANRTAKMAADADCPAVGATITRTVDRTVPASADDLEMDLLGVVPEHDSGGPVAATAPDGEAASAYREIAAGLPAVDASEIIPYGPAREDVPAGRISSETTEQPADAATDESEQATEATSTAVGDEQTTDERARDRTGRDDGDGEPHDAATDGNTGDTNRDDGGTDAADDTPPESGREGDSPGETAAVGGRDTENETVPVDPDRGVEEIGSTDPGSPPIQSAENTARPVRRERAEDGTTTQ